MADHPAHLNNITAAALAERLGGRLSGDAAFVIRGIGALDEAGPDMLTWLGAKKLLPRLAKSRAGAVLLPEEYAPPARMAAIFVRDPDVAACEALRLLGPPPVRVPEGVHPTAIVAADAEVAGAALGPHVVVESAARIGPGSQLHAGVYIGPDAEIGPDCVLWPNVVVRERTKIGARVIIHPNVTIGSDGFGYIQREGRHVKIPQIGRVVIEDDVEIGANACIDRARSGVTRIGRGTKIDNLVQVGHNVSIGEHCILVGQCGVSGSSSLEPYVVLAGQVGVADHLNIGAGAQVAAKSAVGRDLPGGKVYSGIPALEHRENLRHQVLARRLPRLIEQLQELAERVERLESATDHRKTS